MDHQRMQQRHDGTPNRGGFTLIELLVVIAIMSILIVLLVAAFGRMFGTAREKATRATIEKVNALISGRMQGFDRSIEQGELRSIVITRKAFWLGKGKSASKAEELAEIEARKIGLRQVLPQTWAEVQSSGAGTPPPGNVLSDADSSEVLHWVLTEGVNLGYETIGSDYFTANEVGDTDNDGIPEFLDGWERPFRFYRWPTRLLKPNGDNGSPPMVPADNSDVDLSYASLLIDGLNKQMADIDPDDPKGAITIKEATEHTPSTYHTPLLVSAGEDGELGLHEPGDTAQFGYLAKPSVTGPAGDSVIADNITNRQRLGSE